MLWDFYNISNRSNTLSGDIDIKTSTNLSVKLCVSLSRRYLYRNIIFVFILYIALQDINFGENKISFISDQAFTKLIYLTSLSLEKNRITAYPRLESCRHDMINLNLGSNNLPGIEFGYFESFHKLKGLALNGNRIPRLTKNETKGLFDLEVLNVAGNQIPSVLCDTFDDSSKLRILEIAGNRLSDLPCVRSNPETWSLRKLNLAGNQLTDGHNASVAAHLKNVIILNAANNNLTELRNFLTEMPALQLLWLNGNRHLRDNPADFSNSGNLIWVKYDGSVLRRPPLFGRVKQSLDYLDLGKNKIHCVDIDHISNMRKMEILNFTYNKLKLFPDIGCLNQTASSNIHDIYFPQLKEIILTYNKIFEFPLLPGMPSKSIVRLQHNELIDFHILPERLALLTKVGILQMQFNKVTEFPDFSRAASYNMTDLDLSHNNISSIPNGNIAPLVSLEHLRLHHNVMTYLPDMSFVHMALKHLYIHHNLISKLDPMILPSGQLWALTHFYASHNLLVQVPRVLINQLRSLIHLDISHNSLEVMPCVSGVGPSLETLLIQQNNLRNVPAECIHGLNGLKKLNLVNNFIANFPFTKMVEGHLPSLKNFNISDNLIMFIPNLDSSLIPKSLHMDINSNNLQCTNEICWLKRFTRFTLYREEKLCASPPKFADLAFDDISEVDLGCYCE